VRKPLCIDGFCGLGGWAEGFLAEGWDVIGFDIERHVYGQHRYPGQLVIQDLLTVHGSQFRDADCLVMSPPCQEYSYMAMPWARAKAKAAAIRADETGRALADLNRLFDACFRIQAQASLAAGRHIPMVVENVRGAQPWVGRARWNFGSFYLWGDVPALMPFTGVRKVAAPHLHLGGGHSWNAAGGDAAQKREVVRYDPRHALRRAAEAVKVPGFRFDGSGRSFQSASVAVKNGNDWLFGSGEDCSLQRRQGSGTSARKAASAMIAKIPFSLARHIAATFRS